MPVSNVMQGARLSFVTRKIEGPVTQFKTKWDAKLKKLTTEPVVVKDAYMIYLPTGNSYRLTHKQMMERGFDKQPTIMNMERVNKPDTAAGRFKFAINDESRQAAWRELEEEVIRLCRRRQGHLEHSEEEMTNVQGAA